MARPKKDDQDARTHQTNQRWTAAELAHLDLQSARAGLSRSEFIRRAALNQALPSSATSIDPTVIVALNRVGNNVNQLARSVHRGRDFPDYWQAIGEELRCVLHRALDEIAK